MLYRISVLIELIVVIIATFPLLQYSDPPRTDEVESVRAYTRQIEFDYIRWSLDAMMTKLKAGSINLPFSVDKASQKFIVMEYLQITNLVMDRENKLEQIYSDPNIQDKQTASASLRADLEALQVRQTGLAALSEAVIQEQVGEILNEIELTSLGQPIPFVLYHASPVPRALIVSRRERIEQVANISIDSSLTINEQSVLEKNVDQGLDFSSLVVGIGGIGVYPTMVLTTTDIHWLFETVAHEWTHNYLTLRPLGLLYDSTPELRTMNETTASIVGTEISNLVLNHYYPEFAAPNSANENLIEWQNYPPDPQPTRPVFDFRTEMHETRVKTDKLLSEGKIDEAEAYMESRRQVFIDNGYVLRKINQAYFAFYGAYADVPGGAAGEDPVGPAVRELRTQSTTLKEFLDKIAWMTSFEELQASIH